MDLISFWQAQRKAITNKTKYIETPDHVLTRLVLGFFLCLNGKYFKKISDRRTITRMRNATRAAFSTSLGLTGKLESLGASFLVVKSKDR